MSVSLLLAIDHGIQVHLLSTGEGSDRTYQAGGEEVTILGYDVSEWRRSYQHTVNKAGGEEVTILGYDVSEWRRSYQHTVNKVCSCEGVVIGLIRPVVRR
ncbi:hypothetical protein J6590_057549 [Homalodisca vitripennis]|nr:hypothetical protein J6590_057549 [Homalodisca vitripennis]